MLPERPRIDMPLSLVFLSLVANIVVTALTLMCASTSVHMAMRVAAVSWKCRVISSSVDGQSVAVDGVGRQGSSRSRANNNNCH